jgi:predicted enzyme related to lactoylglutathione lyase
LHCHPDVKVCAECVGWLQGQLRKMDVTTILPVLDMAASVAFYEAAGFDVRVYRDDHEEGEYAFVSYDDEGVFDLGVQPSAVGAGCFIIVRDADGWHARLRALGSDVTPVVDEPWGMREFALTDPSGNRLRIGHNRG